MCRARDCGSSPFCAVVSSCSFAGVSPWFPTWPSRLGATFSHQAQPPRAPPRHPGLCSPPGVSPRPRGRWHSLLSASPRPPVLCSDLRAPRVVVSPHVRLRGLHDERLLDDQTVISEHRSRVCFPARLCWGPRTAPRFWHSSTTAATPPSARVWGARAKEEGPEGPRHALPRVLPLWSRRRCLTPEPRPGRASRELVRKATPGSPLEVPSRAGDTGRCLVGEARPRVSWGDQAPVLPDPARPKPKHNQREVQGLGLSWELLPRASAGTAQQESSIQRKARCSAAASEPLSRVQERWGARSPGPRHPRRAPTLHAGQSQDSSLRPACDTGGPRAGVPHPGRSPRPHCTGLEWIDAFTALTGSQGARNRAWWHEVFRCRSRVRERGRFGFSLGRALSRRDWPGRAVGCAEGPCPWLGTAPCHRGEGSRSSRSADTSEPARPCPRHFSRRI